MIYWICFFCVFLPNAGFSGEKRPEELFIIEPPKYTAAVKIEYVTSNSGKFEEAQHILAGWELGRVDLDLQEVQGERQEIARAKAKEALRILNGPLIVEDCSLCCNALRGLPGPYVKEFTLRLGAEGIADLIHRYDDHSAQAICTVAFIKPGADPICFEGILEGTIVKPRGTTLYGLNGIFVPKGHMMTLGEYSMEQICEISMRRLALMQPKHYLETVEPTVIPSQATLNNLNGAQKKYDVKNLPDMHDTADNISYLSKDIDGYSN